VDNCAVEVGLLRKKPCGHPAVAKCLNCEMALCTSHAVPVLSATKQKTGKMLCAECEKAQKASDKAAAAAAYSRPPPDLKKAAPKPGAAPAPAAAASKPAPAAASKPAPAAAPKPAPVAAAARPAAKPEPAPAPAKDDIDAPLEFTPSKKK
jgi:hypothetical protein